MQGQQEIKDKEMLEMKRDLYLKQKMEKEKMAQPEPNPEPESLRFEVKLTTIDFWHFMMHHSMSGMKGLFNIIFTAAAIFLIITRWSTLTSGYRLLLIVCALVFTVWQPLLFWRKAARQAKSPAMQQPMYLTFREAGLLVEQGEQHVEFAWELMARLERTSKMFILYMDQMHAYLLPQTVLGEQEEALCRMARLYLKPDQMKKI